MKRKPGVIYPCLPPLPKVPAYNPDPRPRITYWEPGKEIRTTFKDYHPPIIDKKVPAWKYGVPF